jgi:hypothetical protein
MISTVSPRANATSPRTFASKPWSAVAGVTMAAGMDSAGAPRTSARGGVFAFLLSCRANKAASSAAGGPSRLVCAGAGAGGGFSGARGSPTWGGCCFVGDGFCGAGLGAWACTDRVSLIDALSLWTCAGAGGGGGARSGRNVIEIGVEPRGRWESGGRGGGGRGGGWQRTDGGCGRPCNASARASFA